ncbi:hypothetical protein HET73_05365 [Wolbachia endosymbiont of Atemnus politus]|uniref:hypothetical protein n=1 Tax=Wolbachia endosymbiont of Atemnus politus TaxID=2682840 RepID=UPI0015745985|nr:hypothetical protein [Wolbachia endosymbiont of Atemnus politus]
MGDNMNDAAAGCKKVADFNNNGLGEKEEFFDALEKQESIATLEEEEEFFDIPLSIFQYKGYNSDFFTSWYNASSEIFKEIDRACLEKRVLNLALSVLMLPYVASVALGFVIYNRLKADGKTQIDSEENKTKKKTSESIPKRLAYGVLAAIVIIVNIAVLVALIIPATLALATFYLLNMKLSHSFILLLK